MIIVQRHSMLRHHPGAPDVRLPLGRQHDTRRYLFPTGPATTYRFGTGHAPIPPMGHQTPSPQDLLDVRVLVVDDDEDTREAMVRLLQTFGVWARAAGDGEEALHLVPEVQPTLSGPRVRPRSTGWL